MKPEEMDRLIEEHLQAEKAGDTARAVSMYTEDVEHDVVGAPEGPVHSKEAAQGFYDYLTSVEFQHRVQAIVEGFTYLLTDVEREKRWFATKWARQEKEIRKIIDSTQGMYGDLQAVTGRSLIAIPTLEASLETPADNEIPMNAL